MNERIKELRLKLKLSQEEFGDKLGITKASISRIEKAQVKITESNILAICREFNVRREWLETGEGEMFEPEPATLIDRIVKEQNLGPVGRKFLEVIIGMDERDLNKIYQFMRALVLESGESEGIPPLPETLDEAAKAVGQYAQEEYLREAEAEDDTKASFSTA